MNFEVTDTAKSIPVTYTGILPDLFKEGKGVVAQGKIGADGVFRAEEVLAKHDENYMPPEAAEALKQAASPIDGAHVLRATKPRPRSRQKPIFVNTEAFTMIPEIGHFSLILALFLAICAGRIAVYRR